MPVGVYIHKPLSDEHKRKLSIAGKGRVFSKESRDKLSRSLKGKNTWMKGRSLTEEWKKNISKSHILCGIGIPLKSEHRARIKASSLKGDRNPGWKGEDASYSALHYWVVRTLGKPGKCENCNSTEKRMYHWANISGDYKRDIFDWIRLCVPCHSKYDRSRERGLIKHKYG